MAELYFKVNADYEKVARLREECKRLEEQLRRTNAQTNPSEVQRLQAALASTRTEMDGLVRNAAIAGAQMQGFGKEVGILRRNLAGLTGMMLGGAGLASLATNIVKVRGEFQQFEVAFETMLGSAAKAKNIMAELEEFAVKTPFSMPQVVQGAKQLIAFGTEAEDVTDTLRHLGDIASGLSIPISRVINLYGQVEMMGKVTTRQIRMAQMSGIPILDELAKSLGKTKVEVQGMVTAGQIGANQFKDALFNLSSEGGKFFNLMDKQAKTITGKISNIGVALHGMFNEIGQSSEGVLNKAVDSVAYMVEHYKQLGEILIPMVATYGAYKVAMMTVVAANKACAETEKELMAKREEQLLLLLAEEGQTKNKQVAAAARMAQNKAEKVTVQELINARREELQQEVASAAAKEQGIIKSREFWLAKKAECDITIQKLRADKEEIISSMQSVDVNEATLLTRKAKSIQTEIDTLETTKNTAAEEANTLSLQLEGAALERQAKQTALNTFNTKVNTIETNTNTAKRGLWIAITNAMTKAQEKLNLAMRANPIGFILSALSMIAMIAIPIIQSIKMKHKEATSASDEYNESIRSQRRQLELLKITLESTTRGTTAHEKALKEFNDLAKENDTTLIDEKDGVDNLSTAYEELAGAIEKTAQARIREKYLRKNQENFEQSNEETFKEFDKALDKTWYSMGDGYQNTKKNTAIRNLDEQTRETIKAIAESGILMNQEQDKIAEDILAYTQKVTKATEQEIEGMRHSVNQYLARLTENRETYLSANKEITDNYVTVPPQFKEFEEEIKNISSYSYEQIGETITKVEGAISDTQRRIRSFKDEAGNIKPGVDVSELANLEGYLDRLQGKLNIFQGAADATLTDGSAAQLNKRKSDLIKERDNLKYGSKEWKEKNAQVRRVSSQLNSQNRGKGENAASEYRQRVNYNEKIRQDEINQAKKSLQLQRETQQAEIDVMKDGSEKTLRQIDLDYEKEWDALNDWYKNLREEKIKNAKALWEANPSHSNSPFLFNPDDSRWDATPEEEAALLAKMAALEAEHQKKRRDAEIDDRKARNDYLKEYGNDYEKELAIYADYADRMLQAQSEYERKRLEKDRDREVSQLHLESSRMSYLENFGSYNEKVAVIEEQYVEGMKQAGDDWWKQAQLWAEREDKLKELRDNNVEEYGSFAERRIKLMEDFNRRMAELGSDAQRANATNSFFMDLLNLDMQEDRQGGNVLGLSFKEIDDAIKYAENKIKELNEKLSNGTATDQDIENLGTYLSGVGGLKEARNAVTDWDGTFSGLFDRNNGLTLKKFKDEWKKAGFDKGGFISEGITHLADGFASAAEYARDIADASGDWKMGETADTIGEMASGLGNIAQGFAQGGWVGAAIAAVKEVATQAAQAIANTRAEQKQLADDAFNYQHALTMNSLALNGAYDSLFGTDTTGKIEELYSDSRKAMQEYRKELAGVADEQVRTFSAKGMQRLWKSDEYTSLKKLIPSLFDSSGDIILENLEAALDTVSNLDDEANQVLKERLERIKEFKQAQEEATEALQGELSSTFGSLNDNLTDAVIKAVRNWTDAFYDMKKVGASVIDDLEEQMVSGIISQYTGGFQQQILDAYGSGASEQDIAALYTQMFDGLNGVVTQASEAARQFEDYAEAMGWDMNLLTNDTASQGSYSTISESTGSAIEGRATAIYMQQIRTADAIDEMRTDFSTLLERHNANTSILDTMRELQAQALVELQGINRNTEAVVRPIREMRDMVEDINDRVRTL